MAQKAAVIFEPMTPEQCLTMKRVNNNCQGRMFHYHRLLCAGFCAHTDGTGFLTSLDSHSKDSAELLILLPAPKYRFVGFDDSIKSSGKPFRHDALPDE